MTKLVVALAAALMLAPASVAGAGRLPDAEVFAANTTDVITDPADPRLDVRLVGFRRQVDRIIRRGGGRSRGSELLDGVFFSTLLDFATFQRSRAFAVDSVTRRELRAIADTVRERFHQQSVLILVASLRDLRLAKRFARDIGGRVKQATIERGHRDFVG